LVDKLIRGKILEIAVVIVLVILTIPVWQSFDKKISAANVTTLDDYNINFNILNLKDTDRILVSNEYSINKKYTIYLVINDENLVNSNITINNQEYKLEDFYYKKDNNKYVYTLVNDHIAASLTIYDIKIESKTENTKYSYIFEEKNIF